IIQGIEQGLASADKNLGVYRQAVQEDELKELKRLQQEQKQQDKAKQDELKNAIQTVKTLENERKSLVNTYKDLSKNKKLLQFGDTDEMKLIKKYLPTLDNKILEANQVVQNLLYGNTPPNAAQQDPATQEPTTSVQLNESIAPKEEIPTTQKPQYTSEFDFINQKARELNSSIKTPEESDWKQNTKDTSAGLMSGIANYLKNRLVVNQPSTFESEEKSFAIFENLKDRKAYEKGISPFLSKEENAQLENISNANDFEAWREFIRTKITGKGSPHEQVESIKDTTLDKTLSPDRSSGFYKTGDFLGETAGYALEPSLLPTSRLKGIAKNAPFAKKLMPRLKNAAVNAPLGAAEGLAYSYLDNPEGSLKDRLGAAGFGALGKAAVGQKTPKLVKRQQMYKDAKSGKHSKLDPDLERNQETAKATADVLGKDALLSEVYGDQPGIRTSQKDRTRENKKRVDRVESHLDDYGIETERMLNSGFTSEETANILPNRLRKNQAELQKLYGRTEEHGVGIKGKLHPEDADELIKISKELADSGIKTDLISGKNNNDVFTYYDRSKINKDKYFQKFIPTANDIIVYDQKLYSQLTKEFNKPIKDGSKIEILKSSIDELKKIFNRSAKRAGKDAVNLNKVKKEYAEHVIPLSENQAIWHNIKIDHPNTIATTKSTQKELFPDTQIPHDNYQASQKQRNAETNWIKSSEKEQLAFLEQRFIEYKNLDKIGGETQKTPTSIYNFYHDLPIYMKNQKNAKGVVKEFLTRAKKLHQTAKAFQSIATGQDAQLGSRQAITDVLRGQTTPTGIAAWIHNLTRAGRAYENWQFRKAMNQKYVKHYLKPELMDRIIRKKMYEMTRMPKAFGKTTQKLYDEVSE
ncbi:MAG: hypothetical protein ACYST2_02315, partial [Planctomycetota bacterium]